MRVWKTIDFKPKWAANLKRAFLEVFYYLNEFPFEPAQLVWVHFSGA